MGKEGRTAGEPAEALSERPEYGGLSPELPEPGDQAWGSPGAVVILGRWGLGSRLSEATLSCQGSGTVVLCAKVLLYPLWPWRGRSHARVQSALILLQTRGWPTLWVRPVHKRRCEVPPQLIVPGRIPSHVRAPAPASQNLRP